MIPEEEIDRLTTAVDDAIGLAAEGHFADGYALLSKGRVRAAGLIAQGLPWAMELADRWRLACDNYAEAYGPALL